MLHDLDAFHLDILSYTMLPNRGWHGLNNKTPFLLFRGGVLFFRGISYEARPAAFIFPQETLRTVDISKYLATIDEVEKPSNLDVLWELADELERRLESLKNTIWAKEHFYSPSPEYHAACRSAA